jgi:hypothetical protein
MAIQFSNDALGIVVTDYEDIKAATLKQRQKMDTRLQIYVPNLFELVSSQSCGAR